MLSPGGKLERMGLAISHYWRQGPFWFDSLPPAKQILLIADYNLSNTDPKKLKAQKQAIMYNKIKERQNIYRSQGVKNENTSG